jgi:hypothetical protein
LVGLFLIYRIGVVFSADEEALDAAKTRADSLQSLYAATRDSLYNAKPGRDSRLDSLENVADSASQVAAFHKERHGAWRAEYFKLKRELPDTLPPAVTAALQAADSTIAHLESVVEADSVQINALVATVDSLMIERAELYVAVARADSTIWAKDAVIVELEKLRKKGDILGFIDNKVLRETATVLMCAGFGTLTAVLSSSDDPPVAVPLDAVVVDKGGVSPEAAGALVGGSCWAGSHLN